MAGMNSNSAQDDVAATLDARSVNSSSSSNDDDQAPRFTVEDEGVAGGAWLEEEGEEEDLPADETGFYDNLAFELSQGDLDRIGMDLLEKIDYDNQSWEGHDKMYAEGIKRTGLGNEAPGGAQFQGASRAVHPMLIKAGIEFQALGARELFPATGPAKIWIPGKVTQNRWKKADRIKNCMNWQLRKQIMEFRPELEKTLIQSSIAGNSYHAWSHDERLRRAAVRSLTADKVRIPYAATSFYTAERITMIDDITEFEYMERVGSGMYLEVDVVPPSMAPKKTQVEEAQDKIAGKTQSTYNEDGVRRVFLCNTWSNEIEEKLGKKGLQDLPDQLSYLIAVDESSKKVLSIVRNWEEDDVKCERMHWIIEFPFIPWGDSQPIGFTQMIGSLSGATTGALRALLDSAHVNNFPTAARLKGAQIGGQSRNLQATETTEVQGGVGADDIRKLVMPITYNPPSTVLFQLMQFCAQNGAEMVRTVLEVDTANPNMPVGTMNQIVEQGLVVVSGIIGRMHHSMEQTLSVLYRINRMYLTDEEITSEAGDMLARRRDFQGPMDVIPVSDPGTPTEAHRTAKVQTIASRAEKFPQVYNVRNVEKMILMKMLHMNAEEVEELLVQLPQPTEMNAANENVAMTLGRPVSSFPEQDHLAHIQTHLDYMRSPVMGMLPIIAPTFYPAVLEHLKEHIAMWYVTRVYDRLSGALQQDATEYMKIRDPRVTKELDRTIAVISQDILDNDTKSLEKLPAIINEAIQVLQQYQQPQPMDPTVVMAEKNKIDAKKNEDDAEIKRIAQANKAKELGLKVVDGDKNRQNKMQQVGMRELATDKREADKQENENLRTAEKIASAERINRDDNTTALTIAQAEIESGEKIAVEKGSSINPE